MAFEITTQEQIFNNTLTVRDTLSASGTLNGHIALSSISTNAAQEAQILAWSSAANHAVFINRDSNFIFDNTQNLNIHNGSIYGAGTTAPIAWGKINLKYKNQEILAEGRSHSTILDQDGLLFCKGDNTYGQLGLLPDLVKHTNNYTPVHESACIKQWRAVKCGDFFTVAIDKEDNLYSWGLNGYGQLGRDNTENWKPLQVLPSYKWSKVSCGKDYVAAITINGSLYVWGNNTNSKLGANSTNLKLQPTQISTTIKWKDVQCGRDFIIALDDKGYIHTWGQNDYGQLGIGGYNPRYTPGSLTTDLAEQTWAKISCGDYHVTGLTTDGKLYVWGGPGVYGVIGNGDVINKETPIQIYNTNNTTWKNVICGSRSVVAQDSTNTFFQWGTITENTYFEELNINTIELSGGALNVAATETTVEMWKMFIEDTGWNNAQYTPEVWQTNIHPVVNITWREAKEFCRWLTACTQQEWRLPTISEWQSLANTTYPWGNVYPVKAGATDHYALAEYGNYATLITKTNRIKTTPVRLYSINNNGIYDLGGNVKEWVEDINLQTPDSRYLKGASFNDVSTESLKITATPTAVATPNIKSDDFGFRVVKVGNNKPILPSQTYNTPTVIVPLIESTEWQLTSNKSNTIYGTDIVGNILNFTKNNLVEFTQKHKDLLYNSTYSKNISSIDIIIDAPRSNSSFVGTVVAVDVDEKIINSCFIQTSLNTGIIKTQDISKVKSLSYKVYENFLQVSTSNNSNLSWFGGDLEADTQLNNILAISGKYIALGNDGVVYYKNAIDQWMDVSTYSNADFLGGDVIQSNNITIPSYSKAFIQLIYPMDEDRAFYLTDTTGQAYKFEYDYDNNSGAEFKITINSAIDDAAAIAAKTVIVINETGLFTSVYEPSTNKIWLSQKIKGGDGNKPVLELTGWSALSGYSDFESTYEPKINTYLYGTGGIIYELTDVGLVAVPWILPNSINQIYKYNNTYISVGSNGAVTTSNDYITWSKLTTDVTESLNSVVYFIDKLIIVGEMRTIRSLDINTGITTKITMPDTVAANTTFYKIKVLENVCFVVGSKNTILRSTDGHTWSHIKSPFTDNTTAITSIAHTNGRFLIGGSNGSAAWSFNGVEWARKVLPENYDITNISTFNNEFILTTSTGKFVIGR